MQHKSIKPWVTLLVLPIPLLIANIVIHVMASGLNEGNGSAVINILSLLLGLGSILTLLGSPIWIIMLVKTANYNKRLASETTNEPPAPPQPLSQ